MKVVITESKLKTYIRDKFGVDLTGRIEFEPDTYDLLLYFDNYFSQDGLVRRRGMDNYGPIYLINLDDRHKVFYQMNYSSNHPLILDNKGDLYEESDFMNMLGIRKLGLNMEQLLNLYS
jgi:hypothetical protein